MAVRFLHVADLHLGLRVTRFEESVCSRIVEARFEALDNIRGLAERERVDFLLVAGDLFDDPNVAHSVAERAFAQFESSRMPPVYIIPGNHDPLIPGGVWDRPPWLRPQMPAKHTHLLRQSEPVELPDFNVALFPCPLRGRKSMDDPTEWIARHPRAPGDRTIRIGLAHGSLNLPLNLPEDDHLIRRDAADHYGLDYLALGHWHKPFQHPSADRATRTAYSGTHEPMRFPDGSRDSTGWAAYASDGNAERFRDAGKGNALLVTLDGQGAPPIIESREVGALRWVSETRDVTDHLGDTISEFNHRENIKQTLLQLELKGVLDADSYTRLDGFAANIRDRYHPGSHVVADGVLIEPRPDQLSALVGDGVLCRVLARLNEERASPEPAVRRVAEHAINMLYRVAREESA